MAFVDIFNYKKYFSNKGDSNVARIGHVNKLAARVTSPVAVTQTTGVGTSVTVDAYAGVITMAEVLPVGNTTFKVNNSYVTAGSTVLVTLQYASVADVTDRVDVAITALADGEFTIVLGTSSILPPPVGPAKIHFLVIS